MNSRFPIIFWLAMLGSVAMYYVVMRVTPALEPRFSPTLVTVFTLVACGIVAVSVLVKSRLKQPGALILPLALCESAALLGLVAWFVTGWPRSWLPMVVGAAGILLHNPTRED